MIVDDEEAIRCAASVILEANGFTTITAANGFEALLKLHEGANVSVILLDLRMPAMDGQETFRHLRLNWPEIPVIIASGYHPRELGIQFEGEPPDGFLQKPFTFASISAAVHKALEFTTSASALV